MIQGILTPSSLGVTITGFTTGDFSVTASGTVSGTRYRHMHDGSQIMALKSTIVNSSTIDNQLLYWNMDGSASAAYPCGQRNIIDICADPSTHKYYALRYTPTSSGVTSQSLSIEEINAHGEQQRVVISRLMAIDPTLPNFTFPRIATDGTNLYIATLSGTYKYLTSDNITSDETGINAQVYTPTVFSGTGPLMYLGGATPYLTYITHDGTVSGTQDIDSWVATVHCIDKDTLSETSRKLFFKGGDKTLNKSYFWNSLGYTTLYRLDSTTLYGVYTNNDLASFCSLNLDKQIMPTGSNSLVGVKAIVENPWGEKLDGKTINFSISGAAKGSVQNAQMVTGANGNPTGIATTSYTVGQTEGIDTVTAQIVETV